MSRNVGMQYCGLCLLRGIVRCGGGAVASPDLGLCHPGQWSRRVLTVYTGLGSYPEISVRNWTRKQVIIEYQGILKVIFNSCTLFGSSGNELNIKKMQIKL